MRFTNRMVCNFYPVLECYKDKPFSYLEIGVFKGDTLNYIAKTIATHPESRVYGIDPWNRSLYSKHDVRTDAHWSLIKERLAVIQKRFKNVKLIQGYSFVEVPFIDDVFDAVYIDGEHSYSGVVRDFNCSWPLLRKHGVLIFDDYNQEPVKQAVDDILKIIDCEVLFKNRQIGVRRL